jgi:hypothetical protein
MTAPAVFVNAGNDTGPQGFTALTKAVLENTTIAQLNISGAASFTVTQYAHGPDSETRADAGNGATSSGASALAALLNTSTTLVALTAGGARAASAQRACVQRAPARERGALSDNAIGAAGATTLAEALKTNTTLTAVNFESMRR